MSTILINNVRGNKVAETFEFVLEECISCGIPFFMPEYHRKQLLKSHNSFYCPNGHSMVYNGKSDEQKEIDRLKSEIDWQIKDKEGITEQLLETITEKNKLSRQLKRVHKGVCPCCNRSFVNLAKHMETKHKDQVK